MAEKRHDSEETERKDAHGEKLDKILEHMGTLHAKHDALMKGHEDLARRMDALEAHVGKEEPGEKEEGHALEAEGDKAKKDSESGDDLPGTSEKALGEEREENGLKKNDAKRRDTAAESEREGEERHERHVAEAREHEREGEEKRSDSARHDAAVMKQLKDAQSQIEELRKDIANRGREAFIAAQVRADKVYAAFGDAAPRWMTGEAEEGYRVRLLTPLKKHSKAWKDVNLSTLPADALKIAEETIYHDAAEAAAHPATGPEAGLQEVYEVEPRTGRRVSRFRGHPEACWKPFKQGVRYVSKFNIGKEGRA